MCIGLPTGSSSSTRKPSIRRGLPSAFPDSGLLIPTAAPPPPTRRCLRPSNVAPSRSSSKPPLARRALLDGGAPLGGACLLGPPLPRSRCPALPPAYWPPAAPTPATPGPSLPRLSGSSESSSSSSSSLSPWRNPRCPAPPGPLYFRRRAPSSSIRCTAYVMSKASFSVASPGLRPSWPRPPRAAERRGESSGSEEAAEWGWLP